MAGRCADGTALPQYVAFDDVPLIIRHEFAGHKYVFNAPPVPSMYWRAVDWINYVTFTRLYKGDDGEYYVRVDE